MLANRGISGPAAPPATLLRQLGLVLAGGGGLMMASGADGGGSGVVAACRMLGKTEAMRIARTIVFIDSRSLLVHYSFMRRSRTLWGQKCCESLASPRPGRLNSRLQNLPDASCTAIAHLTLRLKSVASLRRTML